MMLLSHFHPHKITLVHVLLQLFHWQPQSVCSKIKNLMLFTWLALFFLLGLWRWSNLPSLVWKAESSIIYWKLTFSSVSISTESIFVISQIITVIWILSYHFVSFPNRLLDLQVLQYCQGTLDLILAVSVMMMLKGILILRKLSAKCLTCKGKEN